MKGIAVIISNKYPFPPDDGKKTVLAGFLAYLIDRFGRDNVLYVVIGRRNNAAQGEVICKKTSGSILLPYLRRLGTYFVVSQG